MTDVTQSEGVGILPLFLTVDQAASTGLACSRVIRDMCRKGRIPATKVGSQWRIPRDRFLAEFGAL